MAEEVIQISVTELQPNPLQPRGAITPESLVEELNAAIQIPGLTNAWTMPIKTRIDMLATGIKTPVGIKIGGPDLNVLQKIGKEIEQVANIIDMDSTLIDTALLKIK